jgi:multiple sugar transport system permease protein
MAVVFWRTFQRVRWVATLILLPMMIAPVVVGFTARMAFTDSYGFVNQILSLFVPGDVSAHWLSDPTLAPIVIIVADAWQWGPFVFLLLLAGLMASTGDEIEAAVVDGAGPWQLYRYIVLPGMKYIIIVALLLRGLDLIKMFDVVALATRGGPCIATETITFYIYNVAFKFFDLGYAAAAAMLMLVAVSVLATFAVRSLMRSPAA